MFDDVKLISTKFSKVGKVTLERYKNLEWVVCRAHGVDTVNIEECRKRNVGVVSNPTFKPCGEWICDKITDDDAILIFGNGSISKEVQKRIGNFNVVNSKTEQKEIDRYLKFCKTIIITIPLNKNTKNYFNRTLFSKIQNDVTIISIARGDVIDNGRKLLEFSSSGKLKIGHFDMLSTDIRNTLISQKNIRYYEHTSWEYNQPKDSNGKLGGYVNVEFADNLKKVIDSCLENKVKNPHLKRLDNVWF